ALELDVLLRAEIALEELDSRTLPIARADQVALVVPIEVAADVDRRGRCRTGAVGDRDRVGDDRLFARHVGARRPVERRPRSVVAGVREAVDVARPASSAGG